VDLAAVLRQSCCSTIRRIPSFDASPFPEKSHSRLFSREKIRFNPGFGIHSKLSGNLLPFPNPFPLIHLLFARIGCSPPAWRAGNRLFACQPMGKQYNKVIKRRRRTDYLKRLKEREVASAGTRKSAKKAGVASSAPTEESPALEEETKPAAPVKKTAAKKVAKKAATKKTAAKKPAAKKEESAVADASELAAEETPLPVDSASEAPVKNPEEPAEATAPDAPEAEAEVAS
jgi:hypothetical protein